MTDARKTQVNFIISFFNATHKTRYRFSQEKLYNHLSGLLDSGVSTQELKEVISSYESSSPDIYECLKKYGPASDVKTETPAPAAAEAPAPVAASDNFGIDFSLATAEFIGKVFSQSAGRIEENILKKLSETVGTVARSVDVTFDGKTKCIEGITHEEFDTVVKFVAANEPVFLVGPAGCGKNELCKQVAEALDLPFYFSNAVTQEYKLTGFTDAHGVFHESQFYKAFKNGGLFFLDELDASIPEVLVILNAAIANRYFDFPAPIGYVEAHENFRVIAAGNTYGNGASYKYVGRTQLDLATLDRFALVEMDYSQAIENAICHGNDSFIEFARDFRSVINQLNLNFAVSYRALNRFCRMEKTLGPDEALKTCFVKSIPVDDLKIIRDRMTVKNKYAIVLEKVISTC